MTEEKVKYQLPTMESQERIKQEIPVHRENEKVAVGGFQSGSRRSPLPQPKRALALKLINAYGVSFAETAGRPGIATSGVAQIIRRSEWRWLSL